jgi:hypothetical protein
MDESTEPLRQGVKALLASPQARSGLNPRADDLESVPVAKGGVAKVDDGHKERLHRALGFLASTSFGRQTVAEKECHGLLHQLGVDRFHDARIFVVFVILFPFLIVGFARKRTSCSKRSHQRICTDQRSQ